MLKIKNIEMDINPARFSQTEFGTGYMAIAKQFRQMKLHPVLILSGFILFFLLLFGAEVFGQSPPGVSEFKKVEIDMKKFYVALSRLSFVIGAVSGILGGLKVYNNWQMGKHHIDVQVISWFSACLFLATMGFFLSGLFGVPLT